MLCEPIKHFAEISMISKTNINDSFSETQFFISGYLAPFKFDQNRSCGGISAKLIHCDNPAVESFNVGDNFHKKKWFINCSYTVKSAILTLRKKILKTSKRLLLLSNILLVYQISHFLLTKNHLPKHIFA